MSTTAGLFDRMESLLTQVGQEKAAAEKQGMKDPGGHEGQSSHPSVVSPEDAGELPQPAPEGFQSSDNSSTLKEQTPSTPDSKPEVTPESAPKQDEVQLGQGVDKAKPTGEDPSNERTDKGDKEDPPDPGSPTFQGGTDHPASGDFGDKYSSWTPERVKKASTDELLKLSVDLGNELTADIANGFMSNGKPAADGQPSANGRTKNAMKVKHHCSTCHNDFEGDSCPGCGYKAASATDPAAAAQTGYNAAASQGQPTEQEKRAAQVIESVVKHAQHQADLVVDYLNRETERLKKEAMEGEDPTGGQAEGEDHGSEEPAGGEEGGGGPPPEEGGGGGGEDLLAAMGGGDMGGGMGGGLGAPPPEMGGMDQDAALQQLAMALVELGIPLEALAAAAGGGGGMEGGLGGAPPPDLGGGGAPPPPDPGMEVAAGVKLAAAVERFKRAGKFRFEECKTAAERKVRNYMKGYVRELIGRNR